LPNETTVVLKFHLEEGIWEAGEVVVIDAAVDKRSRKTDLFDVVLDGELGSPQRYGFPTTAEDGMIRHAAVNEMFNASCFRGIGQGLANGNFVAPMRGVDESQINSAPEQRINDMWIGERTFNDGHIFSAHNVLGDYAKCVAHLSAHLPSHRRGASYETGCLPTGAVDGNDGFSWHETPGSNSSRRRRQRCSVDVEERQNDRVGQATIRRKRRFYRSEW